MRMIRLALIPVFVFSFSIRSSADDVQLPADAHLISWDEFHKMSPERQDAYLEEVRILMMEIEELQIRRAEIDPQLRLSKHSSFDFLNSISAPDAKALDRSHEQVRTDLSHARQKLLRVDFA